MTDTPQENDIIEQLARAAYAELQHQTVQAEGTEPRTFYPSDDDDEARAHWASKVPAPPRARDHPSSDDEDDAPTNEH